MSDLVRNPEDWFSHNEAHYHITFTMCWYCRLPLWYRNISRTWNRTYNIYYVLVFQIARMVQKHFQDLEQKEIRAEKEEGMRVKRIAGQMAKMVREFWANIEKVRIVCET